MSRPIVLVPVALAIVACPEPTDPIIQDTLVVTVDHRPAADALYPMSGATVAIDDANGARQEATTDDDGRVEFDVDWTDGPYDVTVDAGERGMQSFLDIDQRADPLPIYYWDFASEDPTVALSGTASPRTEDSLLLVSVHARGGGHYEAKTDDYVVDVPVDEPFVLVGCEYEYTFLDPGFEQPLFSWFRVEHDGVSVDTTLDLDLTETLEPKAATVAFTVPEGSLRGDDAWAYAFVASEASNYQSTMGWPTTVARTPGGNGYELDVEWLPPTDDDDVIFTLYVQPAKYWPQWSAAYRSGDPATWTDTPHLFPIARLDASRIPGLDDPWRFEEVPDDARAWVSLKTADGELLWDINGALGDHELVLPPPPSSFDAAQLSEWGVEAKIGLRNMDDFPDYAASVGPSFRL